MVRVVDERIDVAAVSNAVRSAKRGAILVFEGVARDVHDGKPVLSLRYEAFTPLATAEMQTIVHEAERRWPGTAVAIVHRTGEVAIGEPSVVIAVGSPHRAAAYEASRFAIDELKRRVPVWKQEVYADGTAWIANAEAKASESE